MTVRARRTREDQIIRVLLSVAGIGLFTATGLLIGQPPAWLSVPALVAAGRWVDRVTRPPLA